VGYNLGMSTDEDLPPEDITGLLHRWRGGDAAALESLTQIVYEELRRLARRQLQRERREHTLQSTALVNEAFLRLIRHPNVEWQDRAHFFAVSSQLIRRILVDHARQRVAAKRDGGIRVAELQDGMAQTNQRPEELIALDAALEELAKLDPLQSQVVELRFFSGLSMEETAEVMGLSARTVARYWATARLWLMRELSAANK